MITYLLGLLTVKGGTNKIVEYFVSARPRSAPRTRSATWGGSSERPPPCSTSTTGWPRTLRATDRADIAKLAEDNREHLVADPEVQADPAKYYDEVVELDLSELEPHVVGPHSPRTAPAHQQARRRGKEGKGKQALIGSCTNSSYEDMKRSLMSPCRRSCRLQAKTPFLVTPGSERIYQTIKRDGIMATFEQIGEHRARQCLRAVHRQWKRS